MLLLPLAMGLAGEPDADLLARAGSAFHAGVEQRSQPDQARRAFQAAAEGFEELRNRGFGNSALLHDEGNAWLLAGDLPRAILAYRRALRVAPNDRATRENLQYARSQVNYPAASNLGRPRNDPWPSWLPRPTRVPLVILALATYALGCGVMTRWWMTRRGGLLRRACLAFLVAAAAGVGLVILENRQADEALHPLVVIADDGVLLRQGNGLSYPPRYETPLHRGVEARLLIERGEWLKIELAGGETGWVPREHSLVDRP
jgi:tetratricopeptide (TPR) repeat protein